MVVPALQDMRFPPPFQRFVNHYLDSCLLGDKRPNEQQQQEAADLKRRPASATEDVVEAIETPFLLQSYRSQSCRDGPASMRQECSLDK
jgi:hypothetical protein